MEYLQLFFGIILLAGFGFLTHRLSKRRGWLLAVFGLDTLLGLVAGVYLIVTALMSLAL